MTRSTELIVLSTIALVALFAGAMSKTVRHAVGSAIIMWVLALLVAVFVYADIAVGVQDHGAQAVVQLARLIGFVGVSLVGFLVSSLLSREP